MLLKFRKAGESLIVPVFLTLSPLLGAVIAFGCGWFSDWNILWRLPLCAAGVFLALTLVFLLLMSLSAACVSRRERTRPSAWIHFLTVQFSCLALFLAGVRVHITGQEKLPREPFLLVSDHLCAIDPVIFYRALPRVPLAFLSKKENEAIPVVSGLMRGLLCLSIDRENDRASLRAIVKAVQYLRGGVTNIAAFPEGATNKTDQPLLPFRSGVFKIAQKAEAPIVVCTLRGTREALRQMFRRRSDVYLDIVEVLPPGFSRENTTVQIGAHVRETMERALAARRGE